MLEPVFKFLLGDDIFISYSRADGTGYATALASQLVAKNFACRLDQWGTEAGREVPKSLKKALRRSAILVLVGTEGAAQSRHVAQEIAQFRKTRRVIVPVAFEGTMPQPGMVSRGGALVKADTAPAARPGGAAADAPATRGVAQWAGEIEGLAVFCEREDALASNRPSPDVVKRIEDSFTFSRRDKRLRVTSAGVAVLLLLLIGASAVAAKIAGDRSADAAAKTLLAEEARKEAEKQQRLAADEKKRADDARTLADAERKKAESATARAIEQEKLAAAAGKRAEEQTRLARKAEDAARKAEHRAEVAGAEATRQENIARSRELAGQAVSVMDSQLDTALSYSLEAYDAAPDPTFEARQSLLTGLTFSPHLRAFVSRRDYDRGGGALAVSADARVMVSPDLDGNVLLWRNEAPPVTPVTLLKSTGAQVLAVALSPDGRMAAVGFDDKTVKLWDTATGAEAPAAPGYPEGVTALAFDARGERLAVGLKNGSVYVREAAPSSAAGRLLGSHPPKPERGVFNFVERLAFSPDGKSLASYSLLESLIVWDLARPPGENLALLDTDRLRALCFSPDSRLLAFNTGGLILVWDRDARALVRQPGGEGPPVPFRLEVGKGPRTSDDAEEEVLSLAFDKTGDYLTSVSAWRRLNRWSLHIFDGEGPDGQGVLEANTFRDPFEVLLKGPDDFSAAAFADEGQTLVTQSSAGRISTWDVELQPALGPAVAEVQVNGLTYNPSDGSLLLSVDEGLAVLEGGRPRVVKEARKNKDAHSTGWKSLTPGRGRARFVAEEWGGRFTLFDAHTYRELNGFNFPKREAAESSVTQTEQPSVTFDPELRLALAADADGKYYLWRIGESGPPRRLGVVAGGPPFAFAGSRLVSSTPDKLYLWDIGDPTRPRRLDERPFAYNVTRLAFTLDGRHLASLAKGGMVTLWAVGDGLREVKRLGFMPAQYSPIPTPASVAFSPDGRMLATSGDNSKVVTLWDVKAMRLLGHIPTERGDADHLSFSPDGRRLAAAASGVVVWEVSAESLKARAERLLGRAQGGGR